MRDKVIWEWLALGVGVLTAVGLVAGGVALILLADGWLRLVGVALIVLLAGGAVSAFVESRRPRERFSAYDDFRPYR